MAKDYKNNNGFKVIELSVEEATNICNFGIGGFIVCDTCNNHFAKGNCYYIPVLNRCMCKECCDDFIDNNNICDEDRPYENKYYEYYKEKLKEIWEDDYEIIDDDDAFDEELAKDLEADNELMRMNSLDFI